MGLFSDFPDWARLPARICVISIGIGILLLMLSAVLTDVFPDLSKSAGDLLVALEVAGAATMIPFTLCVAVIVLEGSRRGLWR
jgi:hypothetical protein